MYTPSPATQGKQIVILVKPQNFEPSMKCHFLVLRVFSGSTPSPPIPKSVAACTKGTKRFCCAIAPPSILIIWVLKTSRETGEMAQRIKVSCLASPAASIQPLESMQRWKEVVDSTVSPSTSAQML